MKRIPDVVVLRACNLVVLVYVFVERALMHWDSLPAMRRVDRHPTRMRNKASAEASAEATEAEGATEAEPKQQKTPIRQPKLRPTEASGQP